MEELKNNSVVEEDTEGTVVVITDEEGNEYNYVEEMVFDAGSDKYAILVSIDGEDKREAGNVFLQFRNQQRFYREKCG